jgi:serine/threonine protein phosphatase PrpC
LTFTDEELAGAGILTVLASDGLWDVTSVPALLKTVRTSPHSFVRALVDQALAKSDEEADNITVLAFRISIKP